MKTQRLHPDFQMRGFRNALAAVALGFALGSVTARADTPTVMPAITVRGGELDLAMIPTDPSGKTIDTIKVMMIVPGSAIYKAGIRDGDELVEVNGKPIHAYSISDFLPPTDVLGSGCRALFREKRFFSLKATYVAVTFTKRT